MPALDTLPLEIIFNIFFFVSNRHDPSSHRQHPLNSLAATSKHFDAAIEEWTRALLKQHAGFTPPKKSKVYTSRKKWLAEVCQFCYKNSKRGSTLWRNLTCCLSCDKKHFPKVTMTNAIKQYNLSKLDIFTPNCLHPTLPPLAHGEYSVMGGVATMIYEPHLIARSEHIHGRLSDIDILDANLRKRIRRHDVLVAHMEVVYSTRWKMWYRSPRVRKEEKERPGRASMATQDSRDEFVQRGLMQERKAMGTEGALETSIELD